MAAPTPPEPKFNAPGLALAAAIKSLIEFQPRCGGVTSTRTVPDATSGFRAYRPEILETIPWDRLRSPGYSFLVEVLYWASRSGPTRVHEVPIVFTERRLGQSKMGLREIVLGASNLLRLRARLWRP